MMDREKTANSSAVLCRAPSVGTSSNYDIFYHLYVCITHSVFINPSLAFVLFTVCCHSLPLSAKPITHNHRNGQSSGHEFVMNAIELNIERGCPNLFPLYLVELSG